MDVLDIQRGYELSLNQKELWSSYNGNINHYYNQVIISIDGPLDEVKLLAAIKSVISKHEVLSSKCILNQASIFPSQISFEDSKTDFFSSAILTDTISDVSSEANKYLDFPYDPFSNEPVRFYLGKLHAEKSFFVMRLYSLWGDSYSCDLFYKELYNEYFNLEQEENSVIIYSNFSQWQNDLTNEPDEIAIDFWKNYNNIPKTDLFPLKEKKESSFSPQRVELLNWGGDKYKEISDLSVSLNSGVNDLLLGIFGAYLTGFSTEEITIGYTPFKRNYNELDYTLGLVTKTLPVKFNRNDSGDLQKTVTALKQTIDEVISLSDYFYLENPAISFFDFCFEYIEVKKYDPVNDKNIHFQRSDCYSVTGTFLVKLFCVDYGDRIAFDLYYDQSRISPVEIRLLGAQLKKRLENVFTGEINQLSDFEEQIISAANFTDQPFNPDLTVLDLFKTQVSTNPDHIAIVHGSNTITYKELDERSDQLAGYLKSTYTIKHNDLIAIILERSPQMIIAILGIIKSGAAYVPIDPEYPQQRINYILSDSCAKLLICEKDSQQSISKETGIAALCIDDEFSDGNNNNTLLEKHDVSDLAYIIYTSGSTGKPKGCLITHANLANYIQWSNQYYFEGNDFGNWGFITSISFDLTVTSLYTSLTRGKKIIIPGSQHQDILALLEDSFTDPDVDTLKLTPSHLSLLNGLNIPKTNVSIVICGGEQLLPEQINAVWKINKDIIIYNEYGPTETTVGSLIKRIEKDDSRILIGKPIANTRVYLLDDKNLMSLIGQPGEICIGGNGVSDGYLNNPDLTKERFIFNPLNPSEKIYRTGDIGRWDADGNIELFGRKDDQIKIHGYRIEPGEIETVLQRHTAIEAAAVIARFTSAGEQELVAYIVSKEKIDITGLRTYVYENLPVYMLPNKFVRLEALPLTTNGKLDRKALPDPEGLEMGSGTDYLAPRNELEEHLVSIFAEVLKKDNIGVKDNFFALGGDSIKSIQMVSRIKKRGYTLTVRDVMQHPVLEDLARQLKLLSRVSDQGVVTGAVALSPIQHYFLSRTNVNPHHFNQSVLLECKGLISERGLHLALEKLVAHHDALRMIYRQGLSGWEQENLGLGYGYSLEVVTVIPEGLKFEEYCNQVQSGIDLSSGPLFKAVLFRGDPGDRLLLVCHHLVIDGVSWRILFEDLSALYGQYSSGLALELPQKTDSFLYWQHQLGLYAGSAALQKERAYWNEINSIGLISLELDYKGGSNLVRDISSASFTLDQEETKQLLTACYQAYQTDTNDILLTGLSLALKDVFGLKKVLVNLEGHGREDIGSDIDVSRTVGWFTTMYPVLLDLGDTGELISGLVSVKESLHRVPNKGIGYGVLAAVGEENFSAVHPEITFNYLGDFGSGVEGANGEELFSFSGEAHGNDVSGEMSRWEVLNISGIVAEGCLCMSVTYSQEQYSAAKITRLLKSYAQNLTNLIKVLVAQKQTLLTPVDLTYNNLSIAQVHLLNSDYRLSDVYPLSPLQEGLYYHWLSNPSSSAYFEQMSYRLQGALNLSELSSAYEALASRHAVLRTFFVPDLADCPLQVITKAVNSLVYIDVSEEKDFSIEDYKLKDREKGFDLHSGSQMRLTVLFSGDDTYEFIWSHHHILMDGWCVSILIKEFFQLYEGLLTGKDALLPVVHPYADYVKWLMALDKEVSIGYWQKYLSGYEPLTGLPKKTSAKGNYSRQHNSLRLEGDLRLAVKKLCEELSVTENTFIQTVWGILLSRYNYTNDIVFGAVVSGRPGEIPGIEGMIGLFINTIPVRIEIEEDSSFSELLKSVQNSAVDSSDYHYTQLATIQSAASHGQALFDHILVFENYPVQELVARELEEEDNSLSLLSSEIFEQTGYDLSLIILPGAVIEIHFEYNGNVYEDSTISRVTSHLMQLISGVVTDPSVAVKDLDCLSAAEQFQLLESFNDTTMPYPKDQTLVNLFEQQVVISANATALVFEDRDLSYAALNSLANQLGNYLRSIYQVKPNELIGICLERSEWMVIAILGILKAGGAYVPIDPGYPQERIDYMLTDSDCKVVIDEAELIKFQNSLVAYSTENPEAVNSPEDLAYVIYTSGTTGNPKGALLAHYNVVSLLKADRYLFNFSTTDVWTMFHSYCFDFSVWEMYGALLYGGKLIVVGAATAKDPQVFLKLLSESKVTVLNQTPSSFYNLQQELSGSEDLALALRYVIFGGEALSPGRLLSWKQLYPDTLLVNMYGITETTVHVTYKEIGIAEIQSGISNIGKAIPTLNCYVLDKNEHLLPVGVWGELYVGGAGVCQGYLNLADLTTSRFIRTSFSGSERLYRSGDKVRLLENGEMEYGGRLDNQVKIRGYRIELGEIEESLRSYPGIEGVVVTVRGGAEKELVAYVVSKSTLSVTTLRSHLSTILPDYMLPAHFVQLDHIPLNSNGKTDRKSLPDPLGLGLGTGIEYIAPRNAAEQVLCVVFSDVLKRKSIGVKDNFFALGGDSIKSIQVVSRLRPRGYVLTVGDVMQHPVLEDLARQVKVVSRASDQGLVTGRVELSPIQRYFLEGTAAGHHHFNQSVLLESKEVLSENGLRAVLDKLVSHHDALRMVYRQGLSGWEQENLGLGSGYSLEVVSVQESSAFEAYCNQVQAGFDLSSGPLFKAVLFRGAAGRGDRLLLVCHHLVIDGVSWRILFEDLSSLYGQYHSGVPLVLPEKTDSYRYWQAQLGVYANSALLEKELAYWKGISESGYGVLSVDHADGSNLVRDISGASFTLDQENTSRLLTSCYQAYQTDTNDILLTSLGLALKEVFGLEKVLINLEGHGREDIGTDTDVSRTVGWFTTMYPVLVDLGGQDDLVSSLIAVKENLHRVPNKGIGYGVLAGTEGGGFTAVHPDITFNYLGDFGSGVSGADGEELFSFSGEAHGNDFSGELDRWEKLGITGIVAEGRLRISLNYSSAQYTSSRIEKLLAAYEYHLHSLIDFLSTEQQVHLTPVDLTYKDLSIGQVKLLGNGLSDVYPLSPLQEGLYYYWLNNPASPAYFEQMSYRLQGKLDVAQLSLAYQELVSRHAVLRTYFSHELADVPVQVVSQELSSLVYIDLSAAATVAITTTEEKEEADAVEAFKLADRSRGFDLHSGSQMRLTVLGLGNDTYEFVWSHHHILMDGWCVGILIKEFLQLYESHLSGKATTLRTVYPYSDYIKWLIRLNWNASLNYWNQYLSGYDSISGLPKKHLRGDGYLRKQESVKVKGSSRSAVTGLCADLGITENTLIQTAWGILLGRYNNTDDVVFGAVVSGRPAEVTGIEEMIGLFINTIPVRIGFGDGVPVASVLKSVQQDSIAGTSHHYTQLARIQSLSELSGALFDHILVFENYPVQELVSREITAEDNDLSLLSSSLFEQTGYDLTVMIIPGHEALEIRFEYNGNVYEGAMLSRLAAHFLQILELMVTDLSAAIKDLDYLSAAEQVELLETFNATSVPYPKDKTLVDLFEQQVVISANTTALVFEDREFSYAAVNSLANQLANYLRSAYQVKPDELIGICLERNEWMVIAILGVLKSGGAYVPIDPGYPQERIDYMLSDSHCKVVINEAELLKFRNSSAVYSTENLETVNSPEDLAYVIYTSGSTGRPKGVMLEHFSGNAFMNWCKQEFANSAYDTVLAVTSICFDLSIFELLFTLISGKKIRLLNDGLSIGQYLNSPEKLLLNTVPSVVGTLLSEKLELGSISVLNMAGEPVPSIYIDQLDCERIEVRNLYGPTEDTVYSTVYRIYNDQPVLIGRPIANSSIYILNGSDHLQPVGIAGEICIGGDGLARGYLHNAALTAEKFVTNPFEPGERMYRTGDLGRWLEDGNIEYLGRLDDQVKIRGYRIELGEIEEALRSYQDIDGAVVTVRGTTEKELVAYVVSKTVLNVTTLRSHLNILLPDYMLPSHFVQLDKIPLNSNGKADRKSLPDPEGLGLGSGITYVAPRNKAEEQLSVVFAEVLKKEGVGIKDNFFALGGDSIKSIQVVSRIKKQGYSITVRDVMQYPVLENLARRLKLVTRVVDQGVVTGSVALSPIQRYFLERTTTGHHYFNQSVLLESKQTISESGLLAALDKLVEHHDALRMVYHHGLSGWEQENLGVGHGYLLEVVAALPEGLTFEDYCNQVQSGFDLSSGPLFKAVLFRGDSGDRLLLVCHHLLIDGVSWRILFEDLSALYGQYNSGFALELPQKTDSYRYWQEQLRLYAGSTILEKERAYWQGISASGYGMLTVDYTGGSNRMQDVVSSSFVLDEEMTTRLMTGCYRAYQTDTNDVLLTGLGLALKDVFGLDKVLVNLEGHGREYIGVDTDVSRTVGWFTTMYPVLVDLGEQDDLVSGLIAVKENLHRVPNKGIGYGVLAAAGGEDFTRVYPQITFNYLGDFGSGVAGSDGEELFSFSGEAHGAEVSPEMERWEMLSVSGIVAEGRLRLSVSYSTEQYTSSRIQKLLSAYEAHLHKLINFLSAEKQVHLTPVDLTYKDLNLSDVLVLNSGDKLSDVYPLNPLQEGLYYYWLSNPNSSAYFEQMSYRLQGKLDVAKLSLAYEELVSRHAILRTCFSHELADFPVQIVSKDITSLVYVDLSGAEAGAVEAYKLADRARGFDLHSGSQMRLTVLGLGEDTYEFIWSYYHILMDGWCVSILIKEFFQLYEGHLSDKPITLTPVYPYVDYIKWLMVKDQTASLNYWAEYLSGYDSIAGIPKQYSGQDDYLRKHESIRLDGDLRLAVRKLCSDLDITENTLLQTAWGILLSKYNNTNDAVFGAVVSGRPAEVTGIEEMIGLFINNIPVRISFGDGISVASVLKSVQQDSIRSTDHHYAQLAQVQSMSELGRELFDHILVFENYPVQELVSQEITQDGNALSVISSELFELTNYDLRVMIIPGEIIDINFEYNENVYGKTVFLQVKEYFLRLLASMVENPLSRVTELDYLSKSEKDNLLFAFNQTTVSYEKEKTVVDLFEERVLLDGDKTALVFEGQELSYSELNGLANQLANYLRTNYHVEPDELIGICLERSDLLVIALFGILKSGSAYVPVDPAYPQERIDFMLADSRCKVVLDEEEIKKFKLTATKYSKENLHLPVQTEALAYVIYTSGSTGLPKGCAVTHGSLFNYVSWADQYYFKDKQTRSDFGLYTSLSFDLTVTSIFCSLTLGGKLLVYGQYEDVSWILSHSFSLDSGLNSIKLTPSHINMLEHLDIGETTISNVIVGGEEVSIRHVEILKRISPSLIIYNEYGPTEATVGCIVQELDLNSAVLIGKPIANTTIYILGNSSELSPVGIPGEICIAGDGLASGYLYKPELTAAKFVSNPFETGKRMYRTGDLGKWLEDGNIEYLGRLDEQVKIRGYRIELGEIENVLHSYSGIEGAAVIAHGKTDKALVAYLVSKEELNIAAIRAHLSQTLPNYMLPSHFVQLDKIPLNTNGKLDRESLPDPEGLTLDSGIEYIAPTNEIEERVSLIWQGILGKDRIGIKDNFFELGGHSLMAMKIFAQIHKEFKIRIKLADVFDKLTIEELAKDISRKIWASTISHEGNTEVDTSENFIL